MREIPVPVGDRSYPIRIGSDLLPQLGPQMRELGLTGAVALIQDASVAAIYGATVHRSLESAGFRVVPLTVPPGEGSKSIGQIARLWNELAAAQLDRRATVVALGGGVAGDLAGFAAATYLRGIQLVQVPTTLLAQVDSSVGGKTGIDLPAGKNLVGSFYQPVLVLADLETLRTLPKREYRAGLAEVIKYGVIYDAELFAYLESNRDAILAHQSDEVAHIVARCCEIKAEVVSQDERESGLRAILNYGHTVGHAVEAVAGYGRYLHGEAIAIGMVAAGELSVRAGWLTREHAARIHDLIKHYGLPTHLEQPLDEEALVQAMRLDKKTRAGEFRFVLARAIGTVDVAPISEPEARAALKTIQPEV